MLSQESIDKVSPNSPITIGDDSVAAHALTDTLNEADLGFLLWLNQLSSWRPLAIFFRVVSRLGDGVFWYSIIAILLYKQLYLPALHMVLVALASLAIYKIIKSYTSRPRPYVENQNVVLRARALDEYSFPSGHTLHAVSLTLIVLFYFPVMGLFLVPFTLLIMASRCILGLHYPSDVLAGTSIGILIAALSFLLMGMV